MSKNEIQTKRCGKCGVEKPATTEYFYRHPAGKYGLQSQCKSCRKEYARSPSGRASHYRWVERNKDRYLEYATAYREEHREEARARAKRWEQENPEKRKLRERERRLAQKEQGYHIKKRQEEGLYRAGFVYLIKMDFFDCYKIGCSTNPDKRSTRLETTSPTPIKKLHVIECQDRFLVENILHYLFKAKRTNGEWFRLNEEDVAWIMGITDEAEIHAKFNQVTAST